MNANEKDFPAGSRVKVTDEYGGQDTGAEYNLYRGEKATVLPYSDVNEPYIRIKYDITPEEGMETPLMLPNELERI